MRHLIFQPHGAFRYNEEGYPEDIKPNDGGVVGDFAVVIVVSQEESRYSVAGIATVDGRIGAAASNADVFKAWAMLGRELGNRMKDGLSDFERDLAASTWKTVSEQVRRLLAREKH